MTDKEAADVVRDAHPLWWVGAGGTTEYFASEPTADAFRKKHGYSSWGKVAPSSPDLPPAPPPSEGGYAVPPPPAIPPPSGGGGGGAPAPAPAAAPPAAPAGPTGGTPPAAGTAGSKTSGAAMRALKRGETESMNYMQDAPLRRPIGGRDIPSLNALLTGLRY